jgi:ankyrin repeat protein
MFACFRNHINVARDLIEAGADLIFSNHVSSTF